MAWALAFARLWSSNMDLIHTRGQEWPGFSYSDGEKAEMHRIAASTGSGEFLAGIATAVVFMLIVACICVGASFWHLNAQYGNDPSKTPASEFFFSLGLAMVATLAGGMPAGLVIASAINSRLFHPLADSLPDLSFARHLTVKALRQIARMGVLVSIVCLIGWFFIPQNSKLDIMLHLVMPVLGPLVTGLSATYYFSGRIDRREDRG